MYEIYAQFITTVGFPAGAFLLMYKLVTDTVAKNTDAIVKLTEAIIRLNGKH